ncbi:MAG: hypothetical protein NC921_03975 [Candidatus Omnitrophica bacterium]|nr:hypothetical protein [Candidatus Omnitrophota bacterium]
MKKLYVYDEKKKKRLIRGGELREIGGVKFILKKVKNTDKIIVYEYYTGVPWAFIRESNIEEDIKKIEEKIKTIGVDVIKKAIEVIVDKYYGGEPIND